MPAKKLPVKGGGIADHAHSAYYQRMSQIEAPETIRNPDAETASPQLQPPPMYRVVMLNDDFTPMDFVVDILMRYFHHSEAHASRLMLQIHHEGQAICGIFPRDLAETKVAQVETACRTSGHPLRCITERDAGD